MVEQIDLFMATNCEEPPKKKITEEDLQRLHDKKYKQRLLEPMEWELYRLIKYNSEVLKRKTTQKEIAEKLNLSWNEDIACHDHCPKVWTMIKNLNESPEIEKIIISFNFEYWLGNSAEESVFIDKLWRDLQPRLTRYWKYLSKFKENGQGKIISCQNNAIDDESKARNFVESFLNE